MLEKIAGNFKLNQLKLILLVWFSASSAIAIPLYSEKFPQNSVKILLPDPLDAAESVDLPMIHNNNYDMIMPDYYDNNPAASMELQNFHEFYDPDQIDNGEYHMEETQFIQTNPVRPPQPLSPEERRIRHKLEEVDEKRERKQQLKFKKGSTKPRHDAPQWDQFDYDAYSVDPAMKYKKSAYHH